MLSAFVHDLKQSNSSIYKKEIIKKYSNIELVRNFLIYTYDPTLQYGITSK